MLAQQHDQGCRINGGLIWKLRGRPNPPGIAIGSSRPVASRHDGATLGFFTDGGAAFRVWLAHYLGPQLSAVGQRSTVLRIPLPSTINRPTQQQLVHQNRYTSQHNYSDPTSTVRLHQTSCRNTTNRLAIWLCLVGVNFKPAADIMAYHRVYCSFSTTQGTRVGWSKLSNSYGRKQYIPQTQLQLSPVALLLLFRIPQVHFVCHI